jgi:hypothetical protein
MIPGLDKIEFYAYGTCSVTSTSRFTPMSIVPTANLELDENMGFAHP